VDIVSVSAGILGVHHTSHVDVSVTSQSFIIANLIHFDVKISRKNIEN